MRWFFIHHPDTASSSAHAPPPHKLLSSSGARRLQLRSWSSSFSHRNVQRALIPLEWFEVYNCTLAWSNSLNENCQVAPHAPPKTFADFESNLAPGAVMAE